MEFKNKKAMKKNALYTKYVVILLLVIIITAALSYRFGPKKEIIVETPEKNINALSLYHWWTSPGESAAISALMDVFIEKNPDTVVLPTPITGGGGFSMLEIIKPMIENGAPPDIFQIHAGYESKPYFDTGFLEPIDKIWKSGKLENVIPAVVQDMSKFEGHYYSIPMDIHRVNVVWYNKPLLDENKINPDDLTTWENFFEACEKLRKAGLEYPIQAADIWTVSHIFEQIIASMGIDFYEDWINGKITSAQNEKLMEALTILKQYLEYTSPDHDDLSWDQAAERILKGEGAFYIMGDWVNGDYASKGAELGVEYGTLPVPGTQKIFGLCVDTFEHPKDMLHHENADKFLIIASSKEGQDAFNSLKGSISARTDADIDKYNEYQKSAMTDFWTAKYIFPSVVHGSGAPTTFKLKLNDIMSEFTKNRDVEKTAEELGKFTEEIKEEFTIPWSLK